jgi:FHS family glucose/mannose:H+ symporter-like MFS transporter
MILFYILIAMYVAAEIGIGTWLVEFLQQAKSQSVMLSSLFLALFFGTITVGRFLGSFLVEKIGYLNVMISASVASIVCIGIGTFTPPALAFFLPLTGLFFSIMFPTVTAAVSDLHKENIGTIRGLLFTFAGVGGMLGPWLIGLVSDWMGLTWGFSVLLVFCAVMWGSLVILKRQTAVSEPEAVTQG